MERRDFLKTATACGVGVSVVTAAPANHVIDAYCTIGIDREYNLTAPDLLKAMDKAGVQRAVVAPPDRCLAIDNREGNAAMRKAASAYPERLIPTCSANPWYGKRAVAELKRALADGARMAVFHPHVQGFLANDELVFPLLEEAANFKVPIYVHTGPPGNSTPWKVVDLADRFPQVDFVIGHCGATDFWNDMINALKAAPNVYGESSLARPFLFMSYMAEAGAHKGVVGSWAPINNLEFEWEQIRKFLPVDQQPALCGNNLYKILTRRGPL